MEILDFGEIIFNSATKRKVNIEDELLNTSKFNENKDKDIKNGKQEKEDENDEEVVIQLN
jgi:hypothetical protein